MRAIRKPFLGRRMDAIAERLARAWCREEGWQWQAFEELVSTEVGTTVSTIVTANFVSGEVSGAAIWSPCGERAFIVVPDSVSIDHAIHVSAHEAWHLIANHAGCTDGDGECAAEQFAERVGERVRTRRQGMSGQWAAALGAH